MQTTALIRRRPQSTFSIQAARVRGLFPAPELRLTRGALSRRGVKLGRLRLRDENLNMVSSKKTQGLRRGSKRSEIYT